MELKEQPFAPTLAHKLGDVPHVSGLLRRVSQPKVLALISTQIQLDVALRPGSTQP